MAAVRTLERELVPLLSLHWLDAELHHQAVVAWLQANRRGLSLVDCTSFEVMRHGGVRQAFTFDGHFEGAGLRGPPALTPPAVDPLEADLSLRLPPLRPRPPTGRREPG
jgi:uncharacterized protein